MAIPVTAAGKQKYIKKIIKKREIHEKNKRTNKRRTKRTARWKIHRLTQRHNSTQKQCSYFYHWKTKKNHLV